MVAQGVECVAGQLAFEFVPQMPVVVQRHEGQVTGDAGLLLVRQFDQRWRYAERMAACLGDDARVNPEQLWHRHSCIPVCGVPADGGHS